MLGISGDSASHSAPILLQELPNSAQYRFQECTCQSTNSHFSAAKHGTSIHDTTDSEVIRTTAIMWRVSVKRAVTIILQVLSKYRSLPNIGKCGVENIHKCTRRPEVTMNAGLVCVPSLYGYPKVYLQSLHGCLDVARLWEL